MIRVYVIIALLAASAAMAWHIKGQNDDIGRLESEKAVMAQQLKEASEANEELSAEIERLHERNETTLGQIAAAEAEKRRIQAELGRRNAELQDALRNQPEWAEAAVPVPVADSINSALERLHNP